MTYPEAVDYLNSFINYEKERAFEYPEALKLDRMRALVKELGNPQNSFESVLIAGSKGKGSTASILSSVLRMENYRVGLFTSPHLLDLSERIQVNGLCISQTRFTEFMQMLSKILNDPFWRKNPPTYFEVLTAMAFRHFKEMKVHVAVLEVGLGGLYDSTNVADAKVAGITRISLEHTDKLGKTPAKIAVQKCGIIKGREVVVSSGQLQDVERIIQETCEEREAKLFRVGKEIKVLERYHDEKCQRFDIKSDLGNFFDLELPLLGRHQLENAAQAVVMAKALEIKTRFKVSDSAVRQGLASTYWPGRLEVVGHRPLVILDGAHNPDSAERLVDALRRHFVFEKFILVFATANDKDVEGMFERILPDTKTVIFTRFEGDRSESEVALQTLAAKTFSGEMFTESDSSSAFERALSKATASDLVLVTGSLYLVGEVKRALQEKKVYVA